MADKRGMANRAQLIVENGTISTNPRLIRQRFLALNKDRLKLARNVLKKRQRTFVDLLPVLFHLNDKNLPGYISERVPSGISDFSISKRIAKEASRLSNHFNYDKRAMQIYHIHALYMIGSSGTIAYSESSDFDIWVCHHQSLSKNRLFLLQQKCDAIKEWGATLGLEVTFFLMNVDKFREGKIESLSNESSGSAQYNLLLEEFYRTGLLLAGKYPAWWLVPPSRGIDYDAYLKSLVQNGSIREYEFLDFGSLVGIPSSEFFGAALWQLNKALSSPYKSLLKLLLIESYSNEYPNMELLCTRFKKAVYAGKVNLSKLDPYVLMCNKVEEYLLGQEDHARCELARRCFYLKANVKLSQLQSANLNAKTEMLISLVQQWNWRNSHLAMLDTRNNWKIEKVLKERNTLVTELTRSYTNLSKFASKYAVESDINNEDLDILGKRLYVAFERKIGKVDLVNPGISSDLTENRISFVIKKTKDRDTWNLYMHDYDDSTDKTQPAPIKRCQSMIEAVAWCHLNRIIGPQTLVTLHNHQGINDARELLAVIDTFRHLFPRGYLNRPSIKDFKKDVRYKHAALFINIGEDPLLSLSRKGMALTSNRSDALSYGGIWKNLANSFDMITVDSRSEIIASSYGGKNALANCLIGFFNAPSKDSYSLPSLVKVYSFSSTRGTLIARRVQHLFNDIINELQSPGDNKFCRYVVNIGAGYYIFLLNNNSLAYDYAKNENELIDNLGKTQANFSPIIFDRLTSNTSALPAVVKHNHHNKIQVFIEIDKQSANILVLDELGSLFQQTVEYYSMESLVGQYSKFISSAILRRNASVKNRERSAMVENNIEFYQAVKKPSGSYILKAINTRSFRNKENYHAIQVIGELSGNTGSVFSIICNGIEFSSLEYGDTVLNNVARQVLKFRKSAQKYPIYITDVEVPNSLFASNASTHLQISHFLQYKKIIENKLLEAMQSL